MSGAMGVMYMLGLGTKKNLESAYICLTEAAERGNVYAMGQLVGFFYRSKLYMNAVQLARRFVSCHAQTINLMSCSQRSPPIFQCCGFFTCGR